MTTTNKDAQGAPSAQRPLDLAELRKRLASQHGKTYWRSINELTASDEFAEIVRHEFPRQARLLDHLSRRDFLKVLGASIALAGLTACAPQSPTKIMPYAIPPEEILPGKPLFYASAMPKDGYAQGVVVKSEMGRPIKVDGNPRHPISQGKSDLYMQSSILDLYDPDRAQKITSGGEVKTWAGFAAALAAQSGPNLSILTGTVTSPVLDAQIRAVLAKFPRGKWHQYSPLDLTKGQMLERVFGKALEIQYHFDKAQVILSLKSDFLTREPGSLRYSQDFGARRNPDAAGAMNRLYVVESSLSLTGANADHRLAIRSADVELFARALASRLGINTGALAAAVPGRDWLDALVADLQAAGGASLVIAGERQPAVVHAMAHAINQVLGAVGKTLDYTDAVQPNPADQLASLQDLAQDLNSGAVDTLLILEGNPAYTAPADLDFANLIKKAKFSAYVGLYADETAALTTWHVNAAHYLEAWGDAQAHDGTTSIIQPLIEPLYAGKSPLEVLAVLLGQIDAKGYDLVHTYWLAKLPKPNAETTWRQALSDGYIPDTQLKPMLAAPNVEPTVLISASPVLAAGTLEIVFEPDPTIWDGQYSNNAWLQELPKPLTKLTWDNAVLVSPATAEKLGLVEGDVVLLKLRGRQVEAPVFVQPGQADDSLSVSLGYGRTKGGKVLEGAGFNAYAIRTTAQPWFDGSVEVSKAGKTYNLVTTRDHQTMEGRDLVREATLSEYKQNPNFAKDREGTQPSLYDPVAYPGHAWGMAINMGSCIGCNACVLACQAENNIPTVGKDQVDRSREMHWLRIDRYFEGDLDKPKVAFQPVPCMHCETAPCEPVCPVEATAHTTEGINEMTYNRCVGTRYCSNNCPYKVRRFNFLKYEDDTTPSLKAMRNPDVTVRMRGVMEKCTYCVQRVNAAKIESEVSGTPLKDGDVRTACQQACPTNAIVFGDINNTGSQVRKAKETSLNYALLAELGTKPRTTYLARVTNPNPQIKTAQGSYGEFKEIPVLQPGLSYREITEQISDIPLTPVKKVPLGWFLGFFVVLLGALVLLYSVTILFLNGVGIFGINIPVGWGFDIINFVWWIGIGHAGTLISAILLLFRQNWRTSINRFAEAMTLFAVAQAGMYPILHLGRPWLAIYLIPYPNTQGLWPQFRSPLVWDLFAITTYIAVSFLFWFMGLVPDMASLRDRASNKWAKRTYGMLSLGWRSSARHWQHYQAVYLLMAALATPLVVSVHSIVSMDFAYGLIPGWHSTIFPPYFVLGAVFSGFAMVLTLTIPMRKLLHLEGYITERHLDNMAKVMLVVGLFVAYGYLMENFSAWYGADIYERANALDRWTGSYAPLYWTLLICNVAIPQLLWFRGVRRQHVILFVIAILVNVGMWLERFIIIVQSLSKDFLPSSWHLYTPTIYDISTFAGTFGLFLTLIFLFLRVLPAISIFEVRELSHHQAVEAGESIPMESAAADIGK